MFKAAGVCKRLIIDVSFDCAKSSNKVTQIKVFIQSEHNDSEEE
jgi:hypothetical protein